MYNFSFIFASSATSRGYFKARVVKINEDAQLVRLFIDFTNQKYINKGDQLEFWNELGEGRRCLSHVIGRSNKYLLLKVPNFKSCSHAVGMAPGNYLSFYSDDLKKNLVMGKDLIKLLLKKRLAVHGKWERLRNNLATHVEKVNTVNKRFNLLKHKLETQWGAEISALEDDKSSMLKDFKDQEILLQEIDRKIEKYRIEDSNLKIDRWALDPKLYYRK